MIYIILNNHIKNNNILSVEQYGFRSNSSTEKASFKLLNDILQALNNKSNVGGIFCDLEKAFNCVNHNLLMEKLKFYGIVDNAYALILSYLSDTESALMMMMMIKHVLILFQIGVRLSMVYLKVLSLAQSFFFFT
jgi:hypothetical protein